MNKSENYTTNRLLFFDVETPNNRNDKICQIALIVEENDQIIYENSFLINPETNFSVINSRIHKITASDIIDKPTFPKIWSKIKNYFETSLLVGFNVNFDLNVLKKTLYNYDIDFDNYNYLDTYLKSKDALELEKYKLNIISEYLGYKIEQYHNAFDDTKACYFIYKQFKKRNLWSDNDINILGESKTSSINYNIPLSETTKLIQKLKILIEQILSDESIDFQELVYLKNWIDKHQELSGQYPYDDISNMLNKIFNDNNVTWDEINSITKQLIKFIKPNNNNQININDLKDKNVCLTGDFKYGSKDIIKDIITNSGGFITDRVLLKTDFVIIGELGSSSWAYGNFGSKVKKALEMQSKGHNIKIIHEKDVNW